MFRSLFNSAARGAKRREEIRRNLPQQPSSMERLLRSGEAARAALMGLIFVAAITWIISWAWDRPMVAVGQVMPESRVNRLNFAIVDSARTEQERLKARERSPDIYVLNSEFLDSLREPLMNLPAIVATQTSLEGVEPDVRRNFALDGPAIQALKPWVNDAGEPVAAWKSAVDSLLQEGLPRTPLIESGEWQQKMDRPTLPELRGPVETVWRNAIKYKKETPDDLTKSLAPTMAAAGFPNEVIPYVAARLAVDPRPTYLLDKVATTARADAAASSTPEVMVTYRRGELIYARGDVLTAPQLQNLEEETAAWRRSSPPMERWMPRLGVAGITGVTAGLMIGYLAMFYRRATRNVWRLGAIFMLMAVLIAGATVAAERVPTMWPLVSVTGILILVVLLLLAYDRRLALFVGVLQCLLTVLALDRSMVEGLVLVCGCGAMAIPLREIRHRSTLLRAATVTAAALGTGAIMAGAAELPLVDGAWRQIMNMGLLMVLGSYAAAFVVLGILPSFEKAFDITTGLTLVELRDPRHPLLRQLQQKAPGTYNHSLQIANIAEAAAEVIGANGLLVYVGALYHDIGKMNKPEYFVENQTGGINKHERLRPELSLLVIVNHVKDGIELAREYGLPRAVRHFIESHHGTTLVEFFYRAACAKAEAMGEEDGCPNENEFRYPGPKPQTREAAILMIADAVESATRAMSEPTPSRIEGLVRTLSRKRLDDGQFDECALTLKELAQIEESLIKSMCAIYHGRISYPGVATETQPKSGPVVRAGAIRA